MGSDRKDLAEKAQDFATFVSLYEYLSARQYSSFNDISAHLGGGFTPQKLSTFIDQLEDRLGGKRLINRTARSKNNSLTAAADRVYKQAKDALEALHSWPEPGREVIRIGAPNLMIHAIFPKILPSYRRLLQKINGEVDIRIHENPREIAQTIERVADRSFDFAFVWLHGDMRSRIEQLAASLWAKDVVLEEPFGVDLDLVMVCPPYHRFVDQAKQALKDGSSEPWRLDLAQLEDELVYTLPSHRQPLYGHIPPPKEPDRRVVTENFETIISMVRCHNQQGIGIVPGIYPNLSELLRKGQLFYAPIEVAGLADSQLKIAIGCLTKGGIAKLDGPARQLFESDAGRKIEQIRSHSHSNSRSWLKPLPGVIVEYYEYKYCYFVMQHEEMFGVPAWFEGELLWEPKSHITLPQKDRHVEKRLSGHLKGTFVVRTGQRWEFDANGWLRSGEAQIDRLFQFVGEGRPEKSNIKGEGRRKHPNNTIVCTFNMKVPYDEGERDALVGVWSGRDDSGLATVAPMLLSQFPIQDVSTLRSIVNKVSLRCLPNAEAEDNDRLS